MISATKTKLLRRPLQQKAANIAGLRDNKRGTAGIIQRQPPLNRLPDRTITVVGNHKLADEPMSLNSTENDETKSRNRG